MTALVQASVPLAPRDVLDDDLPGDQLPAVAAALPGAAGRQLVDDLSRVECPGLTARRKRREEVSGASHDPIVWARARGANVVDADGNRYVDLTGGFGVALLGTVTPPWWPRCTVR